MTIYSLIAFSAALFLLTITPGPGVLLTLSQSLMAGARSTLPIILGIICGDLLFVLMALFGLSLIAENDALLFSLVQYFGAMYLIWLGLRIFRLEPQSLETRSSFHSSLISRFMTGFMTIFADPKVILFYIGFLPSFIDMDSISHNDIVLVITLVSAIIFISMLGYALIAAKARNWMINHAMQRKLNRLGALIMFSTAGFLLLQ